MLLQWLKNRLVYFYMDRLPNLLIDAIPGKNPRETMDSLACAELLPVDGGSLAAYRLFYSSLIASSP